MRPISDKQETGDTERLCTREDPTGSCSVSTSVGWHTIDSVAEYPLRELCQAGLTSGMNGREALSRQTFTRRSRNTTKSKQTSEHLHMERGPPSDKWPNNQQTLCKWLSKRRRKEKRRE